MKRFIDSVFKTPCNLWTVGQEFCFYGLLILALTGIAGVATGIFYIIKKFIEHKQRKKEE